MAANDDANAGRTKAQPTRAQAPVAGDSRRGGETLAQDTGPYLGPKQGLPQVFGRYRVRKLLAGGGMGSVYLVVNTELEREEALKVPHFDAADDPEVRERFLREARAAAGLDHPNLCPVYDVGVLDGVYYLTMRHLKGKLLSVYGGTAQPVRKAAEIVTKLAQALAAAHARGVVHRDLKPNNVMMCAGVGPVVMDFGLAKQTRRQDRTLTQLGTTLGTPAYMPPEQVTGDLDRIGPGSDVYSLGVILFELLTGRLPFEGGTAAEIYGKILYTETPAPSSLRPGLPAALDVICRKAMAKPPEGRYRSMKEFAAALADFLKAAPWAESAGDIKTAKIGSADIFQVPTIAPKGIEAAPPSMAKHLVQKEPLRVPGDKAVGVADPRHKLRWTLRVLLTLCAVAGITLLIWTISTIRSEPAGDTITNSVGMKLKLIKAGWFTMGSPHSDGSASDDEMPQHEVHISRPFYLGVYPVTKGQFSAFVRDDGYQTEAEKAGCRMTWRDPGFDYVQTDNDPVVDVTWNDAVKFCDWLSEKEKKTYGLPTEAQWEYACRAGTNAAYSFGDDPKMLGDFAWYRGNSDYHTHPVGGKQPNRWGLYDMQGNVREWCADCYAPEFYPHSTNKDPQCSLPGSLASHVLRGGSWNDDPDPCHAAFRSASARGFDNGNCGLRVCIRPE